MVVLPYYLFKRGSSLILPCNKPAIWKGSVHNVRFREFLSNFEWILNMDFLMFWQKWYVIFKFTMHKHTFTKFEFILFCCKFTIIEIDRKFIKTYIVQCRNLSFARKCTIIKTEPFASWLCQTGLFFSLATIHKPSRLCAVTAAAATCCNQVQHQTCTQTPVSEKACLSFFLVTDWFRHFVSEVPKGLSSVVSQ